MPRRGEIIVFLGPTGVGKSTIIKYLVQALRIRGFKVSTMFIKAYHGPAYVLWVLAAKLLGIKKSYAPWFVIPSILYNKKLARVLATISAYLDAFINVPVKILLILLFKLLGYTVIIEEYIPATVLDYVLSHIDLGSRVKLPLKVLYVLGIRHKPNVVVFLSAPVCCLRLRWSIRSKGDPNLKYVLLQLYKLPDLCSTMGYYTIKVNTEFQRPINTLVQVLNFLHYDKGLSP